MNNTSKILSLIVLGFILIGSTVLTQEKNTIDSVADNGTIYTATNKTDRNSVIGFTQNDDGSLEVIGEFATGGTGTGNIEIFDGGYDPTHPLADGVDPLISAYGVFKTSDNQNLLVVNSGDATVSSFRVNKDKSLSLTSTVAAGDKHPLSIASHGKTVYVASSGSVATPPFSGNITGYTIDMAGELKPIANSTRDLKARPTCVAFTSDGNYLVVAELITGLIKVFGVQADGMLTEEPVSTASSPHDAEKGRWLPIPVGFDIVKKGDKHVILVSEARFLDNTGMLREEADKVPQSPKYSWQTGSTSSYVVDKNGKIEIMSGDVMTGSANEGGQIANCWVEISSDGNTLWAANALSSSLSSYAIDTNGSLSLKNEKAFKMNDETLFFSDNYMSKDGRYLNQLIGNKGAIMVFKIQSNGDLEEVGLYTASGLPAVGAYGLLGL